MTSKLASIPDKLQRKATITYALREHILSSGGSDKNYLEVGCDICLTVVSLKDGFGRLTAVDIDHERILGSQKTIEEYCSKEDKEKITLIHGTSSDIPAGKYDVILIDASHVYHNVKKDFENIVNLNTLDSFVVYFHDYGLVNSGVKQFISETFSDESIKFCGLEKNWNPRGGPINDWEAVCVSISK